MGARAYPYLFVGPALLVTFVLAAAPLVQLVQAAARDWQLGVPLSDAPYVGLDNFNRLLDGPVPIGHALLLTAIYTVVALTVELVLGLAIALLLDRALRGLSVFMAVLIVPMVLMPAMVGMVWRLYFSEKGLVNWVIGNVGIQEINWFSAAGALPAVIIVDIWQTTPFFILILLAGLQALPGEPMEAARVDGASGWQAFFYIRLPLLAPLILIAATLRVMELLRQFDVVYVMFGGGPGNATEILSLAVFRVTVQQRQAGVGAAFSMILIALILAMAALFIRLLARYRTEV